MRRRIVQDVAKRDEGLTPASDPQPLLCPVGHREDGIVLRGAAEEQAEPREHVYAVQVDMVGGGRRRCCQGQGCAVRGAHAEGSGQDVLVDWPAALLLLWSVTRRRRPWELPKENPVQLLLGRGGAEVSAQNVLQKEGPVPPQNLLLLRLRHIMKLGLQSRVPLVHLKQ